MTRNSVVTGSLAVIGFDAKRAHVADRGMPSVRVAVAVDILTDFHPRIFHIGERIDVQKLGLVAAEVTFGEAVVIVHERMDLFRHVVQGHKPIDVQTFVSKAAVERLNERVIRWLSG